MADEQREDDLRHLSFQGVKTVRQRRAFPRAPAAAAPRRQALADEDEHPNTAMDAFVLWVLGQAGIDATLYRASPMQRRLPACLRALRASSPEEARALVQGQPELLGVAVDSLLLGVTEFFRDPPVFQALRGRLAELAAGRQSLRILSASCSMGCELYSVGILLCELGLLKNCQLLGTDCRAEAIRCAQHASYNEALVRQLDPALRERYFEADGACLRVREPLRSRVRWLEQDIFHETDEQRWDVILWRNTAIYLKPAPARAVWQRLAQSLRPGGLLVAGKAERPDCGVPLARVASCIYRRMET